VPTHTTRQSKSRLRFRFFRIFGCAFTYLAGRKEGRNSENQILFWIECLNQILRTHQKFPQNSIFPQEVVPTQHPEVQLQSNFRSSLRILRPQKTFLSIKLFHSTNLKIQLKGGVVPTQHPEVQEVQLPILGALRLGLGLGLIIIKYRSINNRRQFK
jgi:hypothetical protein